MALTTINAGFEKTGKGNLYLAAAPTTDPGGSTTILATITGYYAKFYADGTTRKTLTGGVLPWANLDSSGLNVKIKQNTVEVDPNNGSKHPIGIIDTEMSGEITFLDCDPAHLADAFSCTAAELQAFAAASGKAGRKTVLLGGQSILLKYTALYRMPSLITGEYDHWLFPRIVISPDIDLKLSKKDAISCKLRFTAQPDIYALNADGFGEMAFADVADAVAL